MAIDYASTRIMPTDNDECEREVIWAKVCPLGTRGQGRLSNPWKGFASTNHREHGC